MDDGSLVRLVFFGNGVYEENMYIFFLLEASQMNCVTATLDLHEKVRCA